MIRDKTARSVGILAIVHLLSIRSCCRNTTAPYRIKPPYAVMIASSADKKKRRSHY